MKKIEQHRQAARDHHNHQSLAKLLEHIEHQCDRECAERIQIAEQQSAELTADVRTHAAELLRRVRRRERASARERVEAEIARAKSLLRQAWLKQRRELAEYGIRSLHDKLEQHWNSGQAARKVWFARAQADAARVLPSDIDWCVQHPQRWDRDEACNERANIASWQANSGLSCGFVIAAGNASLNSTPAGLLARQDRVAGLMLAGLDDTPPELAP